MEYARFPETSGKDLLRRSRNLPADFAGDLNIVLVAFQQWQQRQVDSWVPFLRTLENSMSSLRYYELPVIQQMNWLSETFINEGMRAGIPDPDTRERTITLYLDKTAFRQALGLDSEDTIHIVVTNRYGQVFGRLHGAFDPGKAAYLLELVQADPVLLPEDWQNQLSAAAERTSSHAGAL